MSSHQLSIRGQWCDARSGATREAVDPARGEAFAEVAWGDREDARRAIAAARKQCRPRGAESEAG